MPTILIIEDDPPSRDAIESMLAPWSYRLVFAASGAEGLAVLASGDVDLVICDADAPDGDGFAISRTAKDHPEWRFVPVILLVEMGQEDEAVRAVEGGADDVVTKPIAASVLRARAHALLRVREQYKSLREAPPDPDTHVRLRRHKLVAAAKLTKRELEVLELLLLGRSHEDVAVVLEISERTSKFHQSNLLRKLGADSRYDLVRLFA